MWIIWVRACARACPVVHAPAPNKFLDKFDSFPSVSAYSYTYLCVCIYIFLFPTDGCPPFLFGSFHSVPFVFSLSSSFTTINIKKAYTRTQEFVCFPFVFGSNFFLLFFLLFYLSTLPLIHVFANAKCARTHREKRRRVTKTNTQTSHSEKKVLPSLNIRCFFSFHFFNLRSVTILCERSRIEHFGSKQKKSSSLSSFFFFFLSFPHTHTFSVIHFTVKKQVVVTDWTHSVQHFFLCLSDTSERK